VVVPGADAGALTIGGGGGSGGGVGAADDSNAKAHVSAPPASGGIGDVVQPLPARQEAAPALQDQQVRVSA